MSADVDSATGGSDPLRWVRRGCDGAVRVAIVAAALCPALASLGGSVVAALLVAIRWCVARANHI